jgi:hypothetical protein
VRAEDFRRLALAIPDAVESAHGGHPDFRIGGRVFASLGPGDDQAMVNLSPGLQAQIIEEVPLAFEPCAGVWGARGYTRVHLSRVQEAVVDRVLAAAWVKIQEKPRKRKGQ